MVLEERKYPKDIKAVFLGGSTADERYKPENQTITGYLNEFLRKKFKFKNNQRRH